MYYLTMKDLNKYKTVTEVIEGYLTVKEAGEILKLSERQIYRIKDRVEREGIKGILHKSRGAKRARWLTQDVQDKAVHLYNTKYKGFNITHVTEYLNTEEKIKISKESLRQILLKRGLHTRSKRHPKLCNGGSREPEKVRWCSLTRQIMTGLRAEVPDCI